VKGYWDLGLSMYEFDREQNQLLSDLAAKMTFVGIFAIIIGTLDVFWALYWLITTTWQAALENGIQAVMYLLIGIWVFKAAGSFRQIVLTQGSDIQNLMKALLEFKRLFTLLSSLLVIFLIVALINIIARALMTFM
jgi:hypothetical protein